MTEQKHQFLSKTHDSLQKVKESTKSIHNIDQSGKGRKNKRSTSKNLQGRPQSLHSNTQMDIKNVKSRPKF